MSAKVKPVVGLNLTCHCDRSACAGFAEPVLQRWVRVLEDADAQPSVIPVLERAADVTRQLKRVDALVYVGWRDLETQADAYGPEAADENPEVLMIRTVADRQKPFLGVGRGMQVLNAALGGSLRPVLHGSTACQWHVYPHNPRHPLETTPGSMLDRVYRRPAELVHSMHELAVDEPAVGFRVTARGPADVVEAIEGESDHWLAVGVQFHPDLHTAGLDTRLLAVFLTEVRRRTARTARHGAVKAAAKPLCRA